MVIRPLQPKDSITLLTEILHAAYAKLGAMGLNYTAVDQSEQTTRKRIAHGDCLVAVEGNTIIGTVTLYSPGSSKGCTCYERPDVAVIGQFGVWPDAQARGVGNLLLIEAERRAALAGAAELALDTSESAEHLIAWYERHAFRFVQHAQWEGKTYRSVIMSKPLNARS